MPEGNNIVTKFVYDEETQSITPVYYALNLKTTEYGDSSLDGKKYYGWTADTSGNKTFGEVEESSAQITAHYDTSNLQERISNTTSGGADVEGTFLGLNSTSKGGAIYNNGTSSIIGDITGSFVGNYAQSSSGEANGGAIYNTGTIGSITGNFINNYASTTGEDVLALGGAIYTGADINITADNKSIGFTGNYVESPTQGKVNNAIFVETSETSDPILTLETKNGGTITLDDTITSENGYNVSLIGDSDFKELKNGCGTVFTGYAGYNGSSQSYSGVNTYQNGGLLGATQTFYKGNFFTAITASAGAITGDDKKRRRNGIVLTLGFRWALGKDRIPIEKVENLSKNRQKSP